jgi:hypothetical protein
VGRTPPRVRSNKGIPEGQAQARERLARRRLRQAQQLGGAAHVAGAVDRIEHAKKVQVQLFHLWFIQ